MRYVGGTGEGRITNYSTVDMHMGIACDVWTEGIRSVTVSRSISLVGRLVSVVGFRRSWEVNIFMGKSRRGHASLGWKTRWGRCVGVRGVTLRRGLGWRGSLA